MKKVILFALAALCSVSLSAQIYVGGNVGIDANGARVTNTVAGGTSNEAKTPGNFSINIAPNVGYILNDKLSVGVRIPVALGPNSKDADAKTSTSNFGIGINPYGRYNLFALGKFGLAAEAGVSFDYHKSTNTYQNFEDKTVKDFDATTNFEIYVSPVLTYALTDHINLEANINLLGLSYSMTSNKQSDSESKDYVKTSDSDFTFGATTQDNFRLGALSVGFTYKF